MPGSFESYLQVSALTVVCLESVAGGFLHTSVKIVAKEV
jgi:hypothetical protein